MASGRAMTRVRKAIASPRNGARAGLGDIFLAALAADYEAHGAAAIATLRQERPHDYVKLVASLLPKDAPDGGKGEKDGPTAITVRFVRPEG